jgi:hypothetical protein
MQFGQLLSHYLAYILQLPWWQQQLAKFWGRTVGNDLRIYWHILRSGWLGNLAHD